jgi:hypothetical protein
MAPLEAMDILNESDREEMFGPIEKLLALHQPFAIKLEREAIKSDNVGSIALEYLVCNDITLACTSWQGANSTRMA